MKRLIAPVLIALTIYAVQYAISHYFSLGEKQYPIHVDGQTEYRRYEYDCDSVIGNYAYRDGVKLKLAGKTQHFFNEKK